MPRIAIRKDAAIYSLISQEQKIYYSDLNKFLWSKERRWNSWPPSWVRVWIYHLKKNNSINVLYCFDKRRWIFRLLISPASTLLGFKFGEAKHKWIKYGTWIIVIYSGFAFIFGYSTLIVILPNLLQNENY